nr:hypothetical protein B0A51_11762 [Rachicladosporium sp. CCFEE 5018]
MPRELVPENNIPDLRPIEANDEDSDQPQQEGTDGPVESSMSADDENIMFNRLARRRAPRSKRDDLHPYTQTLVMSEVDSCNIIEEATFPPQERASKEKIKYRIRVCPELTLGIYTSHTGSDIATADTSAPVYSGAPERKQVLLGHIIATKTTNAVVTDDDMAIPSSDSPPDATPGHKELGRTVCIHSLAVLPKFQGQGLGKTLIKAFVARLQVQDVAERVALIAHEHLVPFYTALGFESQGPSKAQFGGGGWIDMVQQISAPGIGDD